MAVLLLTAGLLFLAACTTRTVVLDNTVYVGGNASVNGTENDPVWLADKPSYLTITAFDNATICRTDGTNCPAITGGNSSWNESYANTKYYLRSDGLLDNRSWNESRADDLYYSITNPDGFITDGNTDWDNTYGFITDGNTNWDNSYGFLTTETDSIANGKIATLPNLTLGQITDNIGNWSAEKATLPNLTLAQVASNIGNFSADGYGKTYIDTLGNASNLVGTCAAGQVVQNVTTVGVQCVTDQTGTGGDGTGGWTNTSSLTNTTLKVNTVQSITSFNGVITTTPQTYFCDFIYNTANGCLPNYLGASIGTGGNIGAGNGHPRRPGSVFLQRGTGTNSGYGYTSNSMTALLLNGSENYKIGFGNVQNPVGTNRTTFRAGFLDSITSTTPTDGLYFEMSWNSTSAPQFYCKAIGVSTTTSLTNYTITISASAFYEAEIVVNSTGTGANCTLYNATSGQMLWTDNITSNLPTGSADHLGFGVYVFEDLAGTAASRVELDYQSTEIQAKRRVLV